MLAKRTSDVVTVYMSYWEGLASEKLEQHKQQHLWQTEWRWWPCDVSLMSESVEQSLVLCPLFAVKLHFHDNSMCNKATCSENYSHWKMSTELSLLWTFFFSRIGDYYCDNWQVSVQMWLQCGEESTRTQTDTSSSTDKVTTSPIRGMLVKGRIIWADQQVWQRTRFGKTNTGWIIRNLCRERDLLCINILRAWSRVTVFMCECVRECWPFFVPLRKGDGAIRCASHLDTPHNAHWCFVQDALFNMLS